MVEHELIDIPEDIESTESELLVEQYLTFQDAEHKEYMIQQNGFTSLLRTEYIPKGQDSKLIVCPEYKNVYRDDEVVGRALQGEYIIEVLQTEVYEDNQLRIIE
jgi:hypothetical protein